MFVRQLYPCHNVVLPHLLALLILFLIFIVDLQAPSGLLDIRKCHEKGRVPSDGRGCLVPMCLLILVEVHRVRCRTPIPLDHQVVRTIVQRGLIIIQFATLVEGLLGEVFHEPELLLASSIAGS
jgi:hypothetical protein